MSPITTRPITATLARLTVSALMVSALSACVLPPDRLAGDGPPPVVQSVDLGRYSGRWFEIARYDVSFQRGCEGVTAQYRALEDGEIEVINACRKDGLDGEADTITGRARVVEGSDGAKLKVSFFGPFFLGDYWVIDLAEDYSWAVVSEPRGRFLWILSRTPQMDEAILADRLTWLAAQGYDTQALRFTQQWDSVEAAPAPVRP
ncbi:lipocalin family protein [Maricaulaceae bacterium MS644]